MKRINKLRARRATKAHAKVVAIYARTAADDEAGTACRDQVRRALERVQPPANAPVYADPGASGLDGERPGLRRLLADVRRRRVGRVVVRDLARLARSPELMETVLGEFRSAGVELVTLDDGGGVAPFGYRLDPVNGLAVHEEEAAVARRIFKRAERHA